MGRGDARRIVAEADLVCLAAIIQLAIDRLANESTAGLENQHPFTEFALNET